MWQSHSGIDGYIIMRIVESPPDKTNNERASHWAPRENEHQRATSGDTYRRSSLKFQIIHSNEFRYRGVLSAGVVLIISRAWLFAVCSWETALSDNKIMWPKRSDRKHLISIRAWLHELYILKADWWTVIFPVVDFVPFTCKNLMWSLKSLICMRHIFQGCATVVTCRFKQVCT
jgi:hypothetical protein